ncbi:MAG: PEP-utilizing enzyme [Patescibacteria group bacterium]|jgi:phosphohistidine swiveling domain-containing protein
MQQIFKKEYTRDNGLIIQEVWGKAHMIDIEANPNPYLPTQIIYINDGVAEIWHNEKSLEWLDEKLLSKNQADPDFFWQKMDEYSQQLVGLKLYWQKQHLDSAAELKDFIGLMRKATKNFLVFYYSALNPKTPKSIRNRALEIREQDTFYDDSNRLISNTLKYLYPQIADLGIVILKNDLDKMPTTEELKERFKNFIYISDQTAAIIKLEDFLNKNKQYKFIFDQIEDYQQLSGQTAYKGKATGLVRILKRKNQVAEFQKGEILVSPMTTPDFVSAMKLAAAFVTDEGGIACHAAILARELKVPCVIGTRFATQIFKDGDRVEVDASKGIVKKI